MTNKEAILEFLEANSSDGYCDDCLSERLKIQPRQQVNQLCNALTSQGRLARAKGGCAGCGGHKLCNTLSTRDGGSLGEARTALYSRTYGAEEVAASVPVHAGETEPDPLRVIVHNWQRVLWFCRSLWQEKNGSACTLGLANLIDELGNAGLLRRHETIMMHTIRLLRNECLYDGFAVRPLDAQVSAAALDVIATWASSSKPGLWQQAGIRASIT